MGLRLLLGPSGSGKTGRITGEIAEKRRLHPDREIIFITPEQMNLQMEQMLMHRLGTHTLIGISVFGFKRLAYHVFEEIGMPDVVWLDDVGKSMVLQRITREHQKELVYFGRSISHKGFIDRLKLMITEIIQYQLDEEQLKMMAEAQAERSILREKLTDICLIWHYFKEYMEESSGRQEGSRLMASEMLLDEFASRIPASHLLKGAEIYIDGYTGFTPQQYRIIEELLKIASSVTVSLTVTQEALSEEEMVKDWRDLPKRLYFTAQKTISKLSDLSASLSVKRELILMQEDEGETRIDPEIRHALTYLLGNGVHMYEGECQHIHAYQAKNLEKELQQVMHHILHLVRDEGYAYRDIHVVCTDLAGYSYGFRRMAELYQVPLFIDDKAEIRLNPLVQWLESLCEWITSGYPRLIFISHLKTGLYGDDRAALDLLENTAIRENWNGKERILEGTEIYLPEFSKQMEILLEKLGQEKEAEGYTSALETYMDIMGIRERMLTFTQELRAEGRLLQAMQYERIFDQIRAMLLQLKNILGGVELSFDEYANMLLMGISQLKMGQLPATLDELTVGDLKRSKVESCRALFVLGLQGGSFPAISVGGSLLTDTERSKVGNMPEIAQGDRESLMEQYYLLQLMMGKAKDHIYLFSHKLDEKGQEIGDSSLWRRLGKVFPLESVMLPKDESITLPMPFLYEGTNDQYLKAVLAGEEWGDYSENTLSMAEKGRNLKEEPAAISPALAKELMDPTRRLLSVTQLERYGTCPYGYFLEYGLRLEGRKEPEVSHLEDGNVLHELLKEGGMYLKARLSVEEAEKLAEELAEGKREEYQVYQTSGRFRYFWRQLQKTAAWSLHMLSRQKEFSEFEPEYFEWEFSDRPGTGETVRVELKDGSEVRLQGKIDRVDIWSEEDQKYIQIIDYKSGSTDLSEAEMAAGVQLQLPVYMEAAEKNFGGKPAGFFYFHLNTSDVDITKSKDADEEPMYASRLSGLYVKEPFLMQKMDRSMVPGKTRAKVLPGALLKSGAPNANTMKRHATEQQMEDLKEFVHRRIADSADKIREGCFPREPLEKDKMPCVYCDYRNSCPYDREIPGTRRKRMETIRSGEFWPKVEKEKSEHEHS